MRSERNGESSWDTSPSAASVEPSPRRVSTVLATGARVRKLPLPGADLPGVFYLRTIADSHAIRALLKGTPRGVVI